MNYRCSGIGRALRAARQARSSDAVSRRGFMQLSGAAAASTLLAGCGGDGGAGGPTPPIENRGVLRPGVVVVPGDGSLTISDITDTGMTLSGAVPALHPGSILVSGSGSGLLRKVTEVSQNGTDTVVVTEQAYMDELFESAEIGLEKSLAPTDFSSIVTVPGVTFEPDAASGRALSFPFNFQHVTFEQDLGDGAKVALDYSGVMALVLDLDFQYVADPAGLQRLRFVVTVGGSSDITIKASGKQGLSGPLSREFVYAVATGNPILIIVPIGGAPVPVVIVPVLTLSAQFTTSIKAGMEVRSTFGAGVVAGFEFNRGRGTDSVLAFTPRGALIPKHNLFVSVKAEMAIAKAKLDADIYALAGPFVGFKALSVEAEFKAALEAPRSVAFTANAVQGGSAGLAAGSALGLNLPRIEIPLIESKTEIFRKTFLPGSETVIVD